MVFWKKQEEIEQMVSQYLAESDQCLQAFREAFDEYFANGLGPPLEEKVRRVAELESSADQKRRLIEQEMFDQALIPDLRSDILGLLEILDRVPNKCESVAREFWLQQVDVPEEYRPALQRLIAVNVEANECLSQAVAQLMASPAEVAEAADRVVEREQAADAVEQELIRAVFASSRDLAEKILLKQVVADIADISDRAEDAADFIRIVAVKHCS